MGADGAAHDEPDFRAHAFAYPRTDVRADAISDGVAKLRAHSESDAHPDGRSNALPVECAEPRPNGSADALSINGASVQRTLGAAHGCAHTPPDPRTDQNPDPCTFGGAHAVPELSTHPCTHGAAK